MSEFNYETAEKAFNTLLERYPDSEPAPMVHLELACMMWQQGRTEEALRTVNEAILLHREDKEFTEMAQDLKQEILNDE